LAFALFGDDEDFHRLNSLSRDAQIRAALTVECGSLLPLFLGAACRPPE
jgi:hypothetical protein